MPWYYWLAAGLPLYLLCMVGLGKCLKRIRGPVMDYDGWD